MKPYASYKPSGVPWLGDVPNHWISAKLKFRLERNDGGAWGADPEGMNDTMVLRSTEQTVDGRWKLEDPAYRKLSLAEAEATLLVEGDLLVTKSSGSETHIGKTSLVDADVAGLRAGYSNFMQRLRVVSEAVPKYVWYLLNSDTTKTQVNILASTTTGLANLNAGVLGRLVLAYPPAEEQQAIADHLDVETARIDTLIDEKDELIGLLREWRQSVIVEAVTVGLDKTATFASHPDPWIGLYPTHWTTKKLKYLGMFRAGAGFPVELQGQMGNPLPFFKVKDIDGANENGVIRESDSTVTPETALSLGAKVFPPHAIVFAKVGAALLLNRFRLLGGESCIDNNMMGFVLHQEIAIHRFMFWAMQRINFSEIVNPGTVPSLNEPLISNLHIAVPLLSEQQAIADYLDAETGKIDDLIAHTNDEIALLRELRAATIADAVLGRVDVRTAPKQ